jgi:hypothetical protein
MEEIKRVALNVDRILFRSGLDTWALLNLERILLALAIVSIPFQSGLYLCNQRVNI